MPLVACKGGVPSREAHLEEFFGRIFRLYPHDAQKDRGKGERKDAGSVWRTDGRTDRETEAVRGGGLRGVAVFVSDLGRVESINGVIISP